MTPLSTVSRNFSVTCNNRRTFRDFADLKNRCGSECVRPHPAHFRDQSRTEVVRRLFIAASLTRLAFTLFLRGTTTRHTETVAVWRRKIATREAQAAAAASCGARKCQTQSYPLRKQPVLTALTNQATADRRQTRSAALNSRAASGLTLTLSTSFYCQLLYHCS